MWNRAVNRSPNAMFLNTVKFPVFVRASRSAPRGTLPNGVPKIVSAIAPLAMNRTWVFVTVVTVPFLLNAEKSIRVVEGVAQTGPPEHLAGVSGKDPHAGSRRIGIPEEGPRGVHADEGVDEARVATHST